MEPSPPRPSPRQAVGAAIQKTTAARLGRGFVPLGVLAVVALVEVVASGGRSVAAWALLCGSAATGVAMLAYGLRVVQRSFGRDPRPWMTVAMLGGVVPPAYGVYVLGWRGLRGIAAADGTGAAGVAILLAAAGVWVLRSWIRVVEVERLASVMDLNGEGGSA